MAGEQSESLPEELQEWVERTAEERDVDRATVLTRALAAYRYLDAEGDELDGAADADDVAALTDRVASVEDDLDEKIADVRERVVQVKRESDEKAPRDHDHPELDDRLDELGREVDDARSRVESVEDRIDRGFENYEEILEYLTDTTDDLDRKVTTLAEVVTDLRAELREVASAAHERRAVDDLRTEANRHGERTAACDDCGATVDVALLTRPRCPHCEATFVEFDPPRGFFGAATLVTGDRPALGSGRPADGDDVDLFETEGPTADPPDVTTND